jgi:hypothetical protein
VKNNKKKKNLCARLSGWYPCLLGAIGRILVSIFLKSSYMDDLEKNIMGDLFLVEALLGDRS